jgi:hypothetical protein
MRYRLLRLVVPALLLCVLVAPARAVIVLGGRDSTGTLDNSGRDINAAPSDLSNYVGSFGVYLGTPIAPRYFITANHIGDGGGGGSFVYYNGTLSQTIYSATLAGVQNDLAIWKISNSDPAFSLYAPLYTGTSEQGQSLVALGRGTQRGGVVNSPATNQPGGWQWGPGDTVVSWGTGTFNPVTTVPTPGFGGDQLNWSFKFDATKPDTGILSAGDSGGPVFFFDSAHSQYQLAGINGLVDQVSAAPDPNGTALLSDALYDARGFYDGSTQITGAQMVPLTSYASRVSTAIPFIFSTAGVPEPSTSAVMLVLACGGVMARRRRA